MNIGKNDQREISFRFCGSGGMGVILASIILGRAAINDGKTAIQIQSYGAEQRGTKVRSDILISEYEEPIFPLFDKVDILVAFSQDAFNYYLPDTWEDSIIVINKDLIEFEEDRKNLYKIPASSLAEDLEDLRVINIIILGSLVKIINLISKDSVLKAIRSSVPKKYMKVNIEGFQQGYNIV
jgi:2-oxoglutarate ferredoxin oxidoreductase subunit gamma